MKILWFIQTFYCFMQTMLWRYRWINSIPKSFKNKIDMLIAADRPVPENSKVWFLDCIKDGFLNTLSTLLRFITAFKQLPAWWLHKKTVLKFLPDSDKKIYPEAIVCLHTILLPPVHSLKYAFFKDISKSLETGSSVFVHHHIHCGRKCRDSEITRDILFEINFHAD